MSALIGETLAGSTTPPARAVAYTNVSDTDLGAGSDHKTRRSRRTRFLCCLVGLAIALGASTRGSHARDEAPGSLDLFHRVAIIGERDERMSCDGFAAKAGDPTMAEKFRATGLMNCSGSKSAANLVGRQDVVLFTAHGLPYWHREGEECRAPETLGPCTITFFEGTESRTFDVDLSEFRYGSACHRASNTDWAIARLTTPATDIVPYDLPRPGLVRRLRVEPAPWFSIQPHVGRTERMHEVIQVSSHMIDLEPQSACWATRCRIRHLFSAGRPLGGQVWTDCPTRPGVSGSALVQANADGMFEIVGMISKAHHPEDADGQEIDFLEYDFRDNAAFGALIDETLLDVLLKWTTQSDRD